MATVWSLPAPPRALPASDAAEAWPLCDLEPKALPLLAAELCDRLAEMEPRAILSVGNGPEGPYHLRV
ncbi:MAG: hypothetical protein QME94_09605 [Anaerolineae bacterium]|nr:hypothetical protein [Anaerolineae bacterium]